MHTASQAHKLWCPMVRLTDSENPAHNRYSYPLDNENMNPLLCRCIAGDCAMWRWSNGAKDRGYCGLAGRPLD